MAVPAPDVHFELIYRRHARDVYRFALAVVRDPAEAEDVTQTTFLNAYRALKRGDAPERPLSWLFAIAQNAIRSRHRWTLRRPKEVPLDTELHRLAVPDEERETIGEVLRAIGELPPNQREALALRELEGLSYGEIAAALGVSVTAVESLISRARRTLRLQRAKLRGLTVLQLPAPLRSLLEQALSGGGGVAAKAAAVVAAATAVAGGVGVVAEGEGGAARSAGPLPAQALVLVTERPQRAAAARRPAASTADQVRPAAQGQHVPRTDGDGGGSGDAAGGGGAGAPPAGASAPPEPASSRSAPSEPTPVGATTSAPGTTTAAVTTTAAAAAASSTAVASTVDAVESVAAGVQPVQPPGGLPVTVAVQLPPVPAVTLPPPPAVTTPQGTLPPGIK